MWQGHGYYTKKVEYRMISHDTLPICKYPSIIGVAPYLSPLPLCPCFYPLCLPSMHLVDSLNHVLSKNVLQKHSLTSSSSLPSLALWGPQGSSFAPTTLPFSLALTSLPWVISLPSHILKIARSPFFPFLKPIHMVEKMILVNHVGHVQ